MKLDRENKQELFSDLAKIKELIENDEIDSIILAYRRGSQTYTLETGNEIDLFGLAGELMSEISFLKQEADKQEKFKELMGMFSDEEENH